ncbi:MAG: cupin domain-containing protein [Muribaculaceae bacterium]|nr:cupin domain-containing protein [Muribaculaceae bacterium]MDE6551476.1 cupin domain-containing protein [Muribaculaceae bacterium]
MLETEFKFGEVHVLADQVQTAADRPQFRNIFSNGNGGVVLVGLKAGQKLDTHTAPAEVMVNVIEGEIEFTMLDRPHTIKAGEFLLMGADVAHSVLAKTDSKIMLVKVKP